MSDENKKDEPSAQADNNGVAVGSLNIAGSVDGTIIFGNDNTVTTGYTSEQVAVLIAQIQSTFQPKPFDGRCPYKGLDVFEEEDAELFFGREKLVDDLVSRVKDSRTVFVTGPSGSGKSSLVRAGLIHALKQGAIKGSERWLYATMKPGRDPIGELGRVVSSLASSTNPEDEIRTKANVDATIFTRWCEIVLKEGRDKRLVLFIDQFEEVFTQISKEEERVAFLNLLTHAATIESGRVIILFSMRSDFVSNCATYPQLNALLNQQFVQIGAMQPEELVSAIAQPALRVGLRIDPELIAQIINEMKGEPGALPLMQFALKDLFDSQQEKSGVPALILNDYLQRGGVHKALERHADNSFSKLSENEQELARSIFSGLIEIGRGTQDTKRTALFDELVPANTKAEDVETIVQRLADARLVTTDEAAGKDTVTISHEKLIDAWPWLKKLVNENRDVIALRNEISADAKEWEERKRDASYLYTGARLINAREKLETKNLVLSGSSYEFVSVGITQQRRGRVALIGGISTVIILLIVAVIVFAGLTQEAKKQANIARSQILTINASSDPLAVQKNLLLSIEALDLVKDYFHSDLTLAEQSIRDSLSQVSGIPLVGHENSIYTLAFSPDGKWLATGSGDNTARLWDMHNPAAQPIVLKGHESDIVTLAFSPDGKWLATGSGDSTARLWDMSDSSAEPIVLKGHEDDIETLAFSPDGNWLATGSWDNTARLWDIRNPSAQPIVLKGHEDTILTLAFSPDGNWLATGSWDATARLWDIRNPSARPIVLKGHENSISTLAFSPDGNWLATGSRDATARLWDMRNPSVAPIVLKGHENDIQTLAFSPDGNWLATGCDDTTARLWDMRNPSAEPILLKGHEHYISTLAFSPDGKWLATGSVDATARLWNMSDASAEPIVLKGHKSYIVTLAISPDGNWLATGSEDTTARLWDMRNPSSAQSIVLKGHENDIQTLAFSPDGNWLATGSWDATARLWDMGNPSAEPIVLKGHENSIRTLAFSPDGNWLATGSDDNTARLWDRHYPLAEPILLKGYEDTISTLAFSPDGKWLATGSRDATARLWDMGNPSAEPIVLKGHEDSIRTLAFSPDGNWLAAVSDDSTVRLWNMRNPSAQSIVLKGHEDSIWTLAFSPDGKWLATGSVDATASLWDMSDPSAEPIVLKGHTSYIFTLAFSPDGNWLATGSEDTTARLWDMGNPSAEPIVLKGHEDSIRTLAFSPDGNWLATGSRDATARLWDLHNPSAQPIVLKGHEGTIDALAFSPDGNWLATGSWDATAHLWNLQIDYLLKKACSVVGRNFTRVEWGDYFPNQDYRKTCEQWPLEPEATASP